MIHYPYRWLIALVIIFLAKTTFAEITKTNLDDQITEIGLEEKNSQEKLTINPGLGKFSLKDLQSQNGLSPLHRAIENGNMKDVLREIKTPGFLVEKNYAGETALEVIFFNSQNQLLAEFIFDQYKEFLSSLDQDLLISLFERSLDFGWESFFKRSLYFNQLLKSEEFLSIFEDAQEKVSEKVYFHLVDKIQKSMSNYSPYCSAILKDKIGLIDLLTEKKIIANGNCGVHNQSPLQYGINFDIPNLQLKKILNLTPLWNRKDSLDFSAPISAIVKGNQEILESILKLALKNEQLFSIRDRNEIFKNALHHGEENIFNSVASILFDGRTLTTDFSRKDWGDFLSLSLLRYGQEPYFIKFFLSVIKKNTKRTSLNAKFQAILNEALVKSVELEIKPLVEEFLYLGANPNLSFDLLGYNVLQKAILLNNDEIVRSLLNGNADPNARGESTDFPLTLAENNPQIFRSLIRANAKISINLFWESDDPYAEENKYTNSTGHTLSLVQSKKADFTLFISTKPRLEKFNGKISISQRNGNGVQKRGILEHQYDSQVAANLDQRGFIRIPAKNFRNKLHFQSGFSQFKAKLHMRIAGKSFYGESSNYLMPVKLESIVFIPDAFAGETEKDFNDLIDKHIVNSWNSDKTIFLNGSPFPLVRTYFWNYDFNEDLSDVYQSITQFSKNDKENTRKRSIFKLLNDTRDERSIFSLNKGEATFIGRGVGGLLLRRLISDSQFYHYIKKAIFVETPFYGTPSAILFSLAEAKNEKVRNRDFLKLALSKQVTKFYESTNNSTRMKFKNYLSYLLPTENYPLPFQLGKIKSDLKTFIPLPKLRTKNFIEATTRKPLIKKSQIKNYIVSGKRVSSPGLIYFNEDRNIAGYTPTKGNFWVPKISQLGDFRAASQFQELTVRSTVPSSYTEDILTKIIKTEWN